MAGTISNFLSTFTTDLAKTNRFDVNVPIPIGLIQYVKNTRSLNYRCEATNLPGRTVATMEQKTYGPIEKYPYLSTYNDIDLTFIVDGDMNQKVFFDAWINYLNPTQSNNFRYKSDYATTLSINQYDQSNNLTYTVALFDAYPISMNQLDLDWSNDGYHKLSITFAYTYWKNNSIQSLAQDLIDATVGSAFSSLSSILPTTTPKESYTQNLPNLPSAPGTF
jgi:hypothetical protein